MALGGSRFLFLGNHDKPAEIWDSLSARDTRRCDIGGKFHAVSPFCAIFTHFIYQFMPLYVVKMAFVAFPFATILLLLPHDLD